VVDPDRDAEGPSLPPAPGIRGALRAGAIDLYYHAIRVVPVNVAFGLGLLSAVWAWAVAGPLAAAPFGVTLAAPIAGLARLGAGVTRGVDVNLSDALEPLRERPVAVIGAGASFLVATLVLVVNVATGLQSASAIGFGLATLAIWGLVALFAIGFAFWPLLVDPWRAERSASEALRLAAYLVLAHPVRIGGLTLLLVMTLLASTIAFAAVVTVSVGFVMLVAARYVLPAADRLEAAIGRTPPSRPTAG